MLTAAVQPNVSGPVAVLDPERRKLEYFAALRSWHSFASTPNTTVTLIETTGYGAARLVLESGLDDVASFDYEPAPHEREAGKGAVEACSVSAYTSLLADDDLFVKVTGRLILQNRESLLASVLDPEAIYVRMIYGRPWVDSRLFAMSAGTWAQRFADVGSRVDDSRGHFLEYEMGRRALIALAEGARIARFAGRPQWRGYSGSNGNAYTGSRWSIKSRLLGYSERRLWKLIEDKQL